MSPVLLPGTPGQIIWLSRCLVCALTSSRQLLIVVNIGSLFPHADAVSRGLDFWLQPWEALVAGSSCLGRGDEQLGQLGRFVQLNCAGE